MKHSVADLKKKLYQFEQQFNKLEVEEEDMNRDLIQNKTTYILIYYEYLVWRRKESTMKT